MRHFRALAILVTVLLLTGCEELFSLHGLYTPEGVVMDAALEGRWENDDNQLVIEREDDFYAVTLLSRKNSSVRYEAHLVDIDGVHFADVRKVGTIGHIFLRVCMTDGELHLAFFDSEWLRERLPHEEADVEHGKTRAVLTVSTSHLRTMVARFAREARAYDGKELVFRRSEWLS